jgi:hypothetical protein
VEEGKQKMSSSNNNDYVLYVDTDSVVGDSIITTKSGDERISDFYERCNGEFMLKDEFNQDFVKECNNEYSTSYDNGNVIFDKIKHVMKHKITKRMFKITCKGDSVIVTENHSIVVERNNELISITPDKIQKTDKIIKIL